MAAYGLAAAVLVALVFAAAALVAGAEEGLVGRVQARAPTVKRWSGILLVVVGAWFLALAVFAEAFAGWLAV